MVSQEKLTILTMLYPNPKAIFCHTDGDTIFLIYDKSVPYIFIIGLIGLVGRLFANGPGDLSSIPRRVISKTLKMVLNTSLLNPLQYKVRIKGKVEQSREISSALPTSQCSWFPKGSLLVPIDYGCQLFTYWTHK